MAGKQYSGDGLVVASASEGARLRCVFQRLNAQITTDGLSLVSTAEGATGEPFRVIARRLGRASAAAGFPGGSGSLSLSRPESLALSGKVEVAGQLVRFLRPQLTEEYSVR